MLHCRTRKQVDYSHSDKDFQDDDGKVVENETGVTVNTYYRVLYNICSVQQHTVTLTENETM